MPSQLVLFIHGLGGDRLKTWGRFPDLIRNDQEISGSWDIDFFSFPSNLIRIPFTSAPRAHTLADGLCTELDTRYPQAQRIVLVCHSLGGLVARRCLLDQYKNNVNSQVTDLLLYGTPNTGASLANLARYVPWSHRQLRQLCRESDFVTDLNRDWNALTAGKPLRVLAIIGGRDNIVREESARGIWRDGNVKVVVSASHTDLVKPTGCEDLRYLILKRVLRTAPLSSSSSDDYKEALPQLVRILRQAVIGDVSLGSDKKRAIRVLWIAVEKTRLHLLLIKEGSRNRLERNAELVDIWNDAALEMSAFDGQLARRLRQKAEFWNVPANWTELECQHAAEMMDEIEESSKDLLL